MYDKTNNRALYHTNNLHYKTQFRMITNNIDNRKSNVIEYNKNIVNYLVSKYTKENKGETKDSVAAKIGVSKSTLYAENPTAENVSKICSFFGIEPNELFIALKKNKQSEVKKSNVVSSPVTIYGPPDDMEGLKKIMYEQQVEIAGLLKEKVEWMGKAHSLEIELERVKNASAPDRDAIAG